MNIGVNRQTSPLLALAVLVSSVLFPVSALAEGAILSFDAQESFAAGETYVLPIRLNTSETLINSATLEVLVDPALVRLDEVTLTLELCHPDFLIADIQSPEYGIGYVSCGTPDPILATSTIIGYATVTILEAGTSAIEFGAHTGVHAHDGFGTQIIDVRENLKISA